MRIPSFLHRHCNSCPHCIAYAKVGAYDRGALAPAAHAGRAPFKVQRTIAGCPRERFAETTASGGLHASTRTT